jgi:hypothetical protein
LEGSFRRFGVRGRSSIRLVSSGLGSEGGSDWVQVDQDGGPDGLQRCFLGAEVSALAGVVAVDDQAEEPFDARSGAFEVLALGRVGELA